MTKKDLFRIIIKIFGLYLIMVTIFSTIPSYLPYMDFGVVGLLSVLGSLAISISLFIFLIFKADHVIDWLRLDQGFDDELIKIETLSSENIIKLSSIIIGGFLVLDNLPLFFSNTLFAFKNDIDGVNTGMKDNFHWAVNAVNIVIGYLLINNSEVVARFIRNRNGESSSEKV